MQSISNPREGAPTGGETSTSSGIFNSSRMQSPSTSTGTRVGTSFFNPPYGADLPVTPSHSVHSPRRSNHDVESLVLTASRETANCLATRGMSSDNFQFLNSCRMESKFKQFCQYIESNPALARVRQVNGEDMGLSALHIAAGVGNVEVVRRLLAEPSVSAWDRDLYGRTALHIASTKATSAKIMACCALLKARMAEEDGREPVGTNAPVDLAGLSPLGWALRSSLAKPAADSALSALKPILYEHGDPFVMPRTPSRHRAGGSPLASKSHKKSAMSFSSPLFQSRQPESSVDLLVESTKRLNFGSDSQPPSEVVTPILVVPSESDNKSGSDSGSGAASRSGSRSGSGSGKGVSESDSILQGLDTTSISFGFSLANGWKPSMEDRIFIQCPVNLRVPLSEGDLSVDVGIFGVFDGHGGVLTADFLVEHFLSVMEKVFQEQIASLDVPTGSASSIGAWLESNQGLWGSTLTKTFLALDQQLAALPAMEVVKTASRDPDRKDKVECKNDSGSTAVVALVTAALIAVAGVGDSRAVVAVNGDEGVVAHALSVDHKFEDETCPGECERALAAGAVLNPVEGCTYLDVSLDVPTPDYPQVRLRMSRAFGDFMFKHFAGVAPELQPVTATPQLIFHQRSHSDSFLVLACDGVWDVLSNQAAVEYVNEFFTAASSAEKELDLPSICDCLLQRCMELGTQDNLSAIIVTLNRAAPTAVSPVSAVSEIRRDLNQEF